MSTHCRYRGGTSITVGRDRYDLGGAGMGSRCAAGSAGFGFGRLLLVVLGLHRICRVHTHPWWCRRVPPGRAALRHAGRSTCLCSGHSDRAWQFARFRSDGSISAGCFGQVEQASRELGGSSMPVRFVDAGAVRRCRCGAVRAVRAVPAVCDECDVGHVVVVRGRPAERRAVRHAGVAPTRMPAAFALDPLASMAATRNAGVWCPAAGVLGRQAAWLGRSSGSGSMSSGFAGMSPGSGGAPRRRADTAGPRPPSVGSACAPRAEWSRAMNRETSAAVGQK
jgi:hypothetical protein